MKRGSRAKNLTILVALVAAIAGSTAAVVTLSAAPPRAADRAADGGGADDSPPLDLNDGQPVSQAQVTLAWQQALRIPTGDSAPWRFVGPTNIGGRVVDLALDPATSPTTVYAAVSSGGIMKSADGGRTWVPAWPSSFTQAMGALARGPDGTLWAGTGEANPSGGGDTFLGNGIYKSTDGGRRWQLSGLPDSGAFGRIAVNPDSPGEVWAAASGWLPAAPVFDLKLTGDGTAIYAATFGRGIYQIPVPPG